MAFNSDNSLPQRHHPAHGILYVEGQPTILFDTVGTKDRQPWLATGEVHALLRAGLCRRHRVAARLWRDAERRDSRRGASCHNATESGMVPHENWVK